MPVLYQSVPRLARACVAAALLSSPLIHAAAHAAVRAPAAPAGDVMTATLAGEFAYQAGQTAEAAHWYLMAAQASEGDVEGKRPGMTDFVGRAKYDAWAAVKGKAKNDAMQGYVDLIESLK